MPDKEKVITHFRDAIEASGCDNKWRFVRVDILEEAIALLKEQEAVNPADKPTDAIMMIDEYRWKHTMGRCGNCKAPLPALDGLRSKFCWMCGRAVKWDG